MTPPLFPPPVAPVAPNSRHAFGGIWRLTARRFLGPRQLLPLPFVLAILAVLGAAIVHEGKSGPYFSWASGFYLTFLMPVLAFISGGGAIRDDLRSGSVDYVLTRPVSRPAFLVFKFMAHLACIQVISLGGLAVVIGVGYFRQIPGVWSFLPWLLLGQAITITAFAALGFLSGVLTSRFVIIGLFYGAIIEAGLGNIPVQINKLAMTHQVKAMLPQLAPVPEQGAWITIAILLAYAAVMLAVAATVFSFQQLAGARPTEA